jgi:hypothetical protein
VKQFAALVLIVAAPALLAAQGVNQVDIGKKAKAATSMPA